MAGAALSADLDTFPKLLARNARELGGRPGLPREGIRHLAELDLGPRPRPRCWRWPRGWRSSGSRPGDHLAIIGRNRPYLYWAMVAAQCCGAVPVPLYQDAVAEEMAYVLEHCGARFVVAGDQEQVDKVLEVSAPPAARWSTSSISTRAGCGKYDHARLHSYAEVQARGREAGAPARARDRARAPRRRARTDICVMLYTSGTTGRPKGVVLSNRNIIATAEASAALRPADAPRTACSPTCRWPGSATSSSPWARPT